MKVMFFICSFLISLSLNGFAEPDYSNVEIKTHRLTERIVMLEGSGGNIGVLHGPDGILMVDDQFVELSDKIKAALDELKSGQVKFLLNTHWHFDHTGGNRAFGGDATIIGHENVRKLLSKDQVIEFFNKEVKASPKVALPVITFDESVRLHFNGETIDVVHLPAAHTNSDSYVYFNKSNVLHAGDLFFNGFFPFIDVQHGGSVDGYIEAVKRLIYMIDDETQIIPGHGPLGNRENYIAFLDMLQASRAFVKNGVANGLSLQEILQEGLGDEWDSWKKGFLSEEKWLSIVYSSLVS